MQTINKGHIPGAVLYFYELCNLLLMEIHKQNSKSYLEFENHPIFSFLRPHNCCHNKAATHSKLWCSGS